MRRSVRAVKERLWWRIENPMEQVNLRAKLMRPYWKRRFASFGAGSVVHRPLWIQGAHKMAIGEAVLLVHPWLVTEEWTWDRPRPALSIGDRVIVRHFTSIGAAESVVLEDDVAIAAFCMIRDSEHQRVGRGEWTERYADGARDRLWGNPTGIGPLDIAPVHIGRGVMIGERVAVLPGTTIGKHSVIGTNSVVRGHIPDYSIAVGAPARVVGSTRSSEPEGAASAEGP